MREAGVPFQRALWKWTLQWDITCFTHTLANKQGLLSSYSKRYEPKRHQTQRGWELEAERSARADADLSP